MLRPLLLAALCACLCSAAAVQAADPQLVARGRKLLDMQGCTACHSLDGSISAGPSFLGRFGQTSEVLVDGKLARVTFDASYVRRSVEEPAAAVTRGFAMGVMPRFTLDDEQLTAITAALAELGQAAPPETDAHGRRRRAALWARSVRAALRGRAPRTLESTPARAAYPSDG